PIKDNAEIKIENYHRIIVPVYIPNFEGYFKEAFEVFKLCIESLLLTIHDKSRITIYNNNCHPEVKKYIDEKYQDSIFIDQVFHSKENLGKINAILAAAKGNLEPIITITDADVLFKHNWQNAVEDVFINFPHAGMVSPVPSSIAFNTYTANNWIYGLFRGKVFFGNVLDPIGLQRFDDSLGNATKFYKKIHLEKYLILKNKDNEKEAVFGCGHFVAAMRREAFDKGPSEPAFVKILKGVETKFIDVPNERLGFLRLATKDNYAYHMGNTIESWMLEEFEGLKNVRANESATFTQFNNTKQYSAFFVKTGIIIGKILRIQKVKYLFLRFKGLTKNEALEY
ncbi:MAG: glycosyltransferase family A protein, partial [Flavobacterium sp.]